MSKVILYHSFDEKAKLEKELMVKIPRERREKTWAKLMALFSKQPVQNSHDR